MSGSRSVPVVHFSSAFYIGYYSATAVAELQALGADTLGTPERTRHDHKPPPAPRGCIPKGLAPTQEPDAPQVADQAGSAALRVTPETVFGRIKQGRGFRQFLLRGLERIQDEWSLICTGHNLLKLFRFGANAAGKVRGKGAAGNNRETCQTMRREIFKQQPACA